MQQFPNADPLETLISHNHIWGSWWYLGSCLARWPLELWGLEVLIGWSPSAPRAKWIQLAWRARQCEPSSISSLFAWKQVDPSPWSHAIPLEQHPVFDQKAGVGRYIQSCRSVWTPGHMMSYGDLVSPWRDMKGSSHYRRYYNLFPINSFPINSFPLKDWYTIERKGLIGPLVHRDALRLGIFLFHSFIAWPRCSCHSHKLQEDPRWKWIERMCRAVFFLVAH